MPKLKRKPVTLSSESSVLILARVLLLFAFGISAYLAWNSLQGGGVPGCGPESDCDKVLSSRWGYLLGFPVSLFALPVYLAAIAFLFRKNPPWKLMVPLALVVLAAAVWFVGVQALALRAFCKFCMAAHLAGGLAALVLLKYNPLPAATTVQSIGFAAAPLALLVIAQLGSAAPGPVQVLYNSAGSTNREQILGTTVPTSQGVTNGAAAPPANEAARLPLSDLTFSFVDGEFTLDLTKVPISGRFDAPKKMVKLFDYTCHHCRDLHHLLKPVKKKYASELAVISLPVPLEADCNPVVRRTAPAHMNACEYAKMALAVFLANPDRFEEFSDYLFEPERPPVLEEARLRAEALVGKERFGAALNDPRVAEQIQMDANIYLASSQKAKRGVMPQLLFAQGGSIGAVPTAQALDRILFSALGLGQAQQSPNESSEPRHN